LRTNLEVPQFHLAGGHIPLVPGSNDFLIEVPGWDGYESAKAWLEETQAKVLHRLKAHIAETEARMEELGYIPIQVNKAAGLEYVEIAARWQVLGQSWWSDPGSVNQLRRPLSRGCLLLSVPVCELLRA